ncbi:hypothetical protein EJP82_09615 [Paenibacillus anaericanus]|uniref:Phage holin n=1 Tax=Paenibacillus anaericanus TaxID=170367 RepID=A0A3S1C9V0_9BACL|nr:phage holin [Paenibacillus anaericanus]RUT46951.1 hypothetical protein EJP82_09615 [Paenibacillus anaericanus]
MNKKRWRNYALWVSVVSQALLLVQLVGHLTETFEVSDIMQQDIMTIVNVVLGLLTTLGIVSNPTKPNSSGFNL